MPSSAGGEIAECGLGVPADSPGQVGCLPVKESAQAELFIPGVYDTVSIDNVCYQGYVQHAPVDEDGKQLRRGVKPRPAAVIQ